MKHHVSFALALLVAGGLAGSVAAQSSSSGSSGSSSAGSGGAAGGIGGSTSAPSLGVGPSTPSTTPNRLDSTGAGRPGALGTTPLSSDPLRSGGAARLSDPDASREDSRLAPGAAGSGGAITGPSSGLVGRGSGSSTLPDRTPTGAGSPLDPGGSFGTPGSSFGQTGR
jgi:hypothetical protein